MEFYQMIGKYYDDIFPPSKNQIAYLLKQMDTPSKVLDLGCATGGYAIALAKEGHDVTAVDLDEAMIHILEHRLKGTELNLKPMVDNIQAVGALPETYDLIYCIGNTVVHLENLEALEKFIADAYGRLNVGGRLVIQSVNYDRILRDQVQSLPEIVREYPSLSFFRRYHYEGKYIRFVGALTVEDSEGRKTWTAETKLLPILKTDFEQAFAKAGFEQLNFYGDFNEQPFSFESQALVALAVK